MSVADQRKVRSKDLPIFLMQVKPGNVQRKMALIVGLFLTLLSLAILPFARDSWPMVQSFVPIYMTAMFFSEFITAGLLLSQFLIERHLSILVLAGTYFCSSLLSVAYLVSFPGAFAPQGLFGGDDQTTSWLWIEWHAVFPLGVLIYVFIEKSTKYNSLASTSSLPLKQARLALIFGTLGVTGFAILLSLVAYYYNDWLPIVTQQNNYTLMLSTGVGPLLWLINIGVVVSLVYYLRGRSVLQLWLSVAMLAWFLDVFTSVLGGSRYSVGWYYSRFCSLSTSLIVVTALVYKIYHMHGKLVRQEQELKKALSLRDEFFSVASHELKTPITSLMGYTQLMLHQIEKNTINPVNWKRNLKNMNEQTQRLTALVDRLLDVTRLEAGRLVLEKQKIELTSLIKRVADNIQTRSPRHTLLVEAPDSLFGWVDSLRFEQVVVNLLTNAVKYSPDGGKVEIKLALLAEKNWISLAVKDEGLGITPEKQTQIFEAFYQVEEKAMNGLGLGLFITRQIVNMHGGTIEVVSPVADNKGSLFTVTLPQGLDSEKKIPEASKTSPSQV